MPTVIEPKETNPPSGLAAILEPFGRGSIMALVDLHDTIAQWKETGNRVGYDYERRRLRLYGESDKAGDAIERARLLYSTLNLHTYIWMLAFAAAAYSGAALQVAGTPLAGGMGSAMVVSLLMLVGGKEAIDRTEIVDHTTAPTEDCDDLKQQYLDGEIDEAQLEAETEARLG